MEFWDYKATLFLILANMGTSSGQLFCPFGIESGAVYCK
jgi:hypothetical protein